MEEPKSPPQQNPPVDVKALAKELRPIIKRDVGETVTRELAKQQAAANPDEVKLTERQLARLHEIHAATGDDDLGELLDELCENCQDEDDDEEEG